jgi:hypothetical protein
MKDDKLHDVITTLLARLLGSLLIILWITFIVVLMSGCTLAPKEMTAVVEIGEGWSDATYDVWRVR